MDLSKVGPRGRERGVGARRTSKPSTGFHLQHPQARARCCHFAERPWRAQASAAHVAETWWMREGECCWYKDGGDDRWEVLRESKERRRLKKKDPGGEKGRDNDSAWEMGERFMTFCRRLCLGSCPNSTGEVFRCARDEMPVVNMIVVPYETHSVSFFFVSSKSPSERRSLTSQN